MSSASETYRDARDSAYAARARAHSVRQDAEDEDTEIAWAAAEVAALEWVGAELHAIQVKGTGGPS